jgi:DNA-binding beta-propeller fold protein YncE
MKKRLLTAALAACLSFGTGCAPNAAGGGNSANGSLGVSHDDALLFAADSDLDVLFVVNAKTQTVVGEPIKVGRQPEKVLVTPDDTVYVTNRLDRSISVIRKGDTQESARISVAVEPVGLAASSDGRTLYVVNATSLTDSEFGTLMAIDTATLKLKWETPVGNEPRGITLMGDGKAAISLLKAGDLVMVDLNAGKVVKSGTGVFEALNASALGITTTNTGIGGAAPRDTFGFPGGPSTARPMGLEALTVSPDGEQVYVASRIATDSILNAPGGGVSSPSPSSGSGYGGGSCGTTAVASPALMTFDSQGNALVDDLGTCQGIDSNARPPMLLTSPIPDMPIQGPSAIALESTGRFLYITNRESNNVSIITTSRSKNDPSQNVPTNFGPNGIALPTGSVSQLVAVGAAPTGIAVAHDGLTAFVYNSFDHSISKLESVSGRVTNAGTTKLTQLEALSPVAAAGRRLFYSAVDSRMNSVSTGISCSTCHLEGREDGHVWNFPDGPRQTPSLQGRMLSKTAPFHWNGEFNDLLAFMSHTVTNRMGGSGVTPAMEQQIAAFIESMPKADNPHNDTAPDVLARGRAAFEKAECTTCHKTETFTDNTFADVGTYVKSGPVVDNFQLHGGLNTPSLLGLARTAPYLHDGSALTLKARIMTGKNLDQHGKTSRLSDAEVDELVSYLKAL